MNERGTCRIFLQLPGFVRPRALQVPDPSCLDLLGLNLASVRRVRDTPSGVDASILRAYPTSASHAEREDTGVNRRSP